MIGNLDSNYTWPKDLSKNDINYLKEFLEKLKNFDKFKIFHKDVDIKGK